MIWDMSPEKGSSGIHTPVQALQAPADKATPYSERPTVFPAWAGILSPEGHKAGDWGHPRTMIPSAALNFTQSRASSVCAQPPSGEVGAQAEAQRPLKHGPAAPGR